MNASIPRRVALVLGGGGLKGFAHIGVLRALDERGIRPCVYAGTSIGSLIAAARVGGMSMGEMADRALTLRRRDLFRINHMGMLLERMHSPSLYLEEPLRELCAAVSPAGTFDDLAMPLLVNTVDVERGTRLVWGLPGLRDVPVVDAIYASCALPGFFPPGYVDGRTCIDGGTIDNLPAAIAGLGVDAVIAVDVGSSELDRLHDISTQGFAAIYMRAATVMMHALQQHQLHDWQGPPMLLVRPRVGHRHWFSFANTGEMIDAGHEAAATALDQIGDALLSPSGVYPRRMVSLAVDRDRCIGCGTCVALAPRLMAQHADGKAYVMSSPVLWSPADGEFVQHCPTEAISVQSLDGTRRTTRPITEPTLDAADD
ncbi:MAG TPA: patatin-like phospholipase family protein [Gemmatimonadaceae bacterium]